MNFESKISTLSGLKESGLATVGNISHLKDSRDELKKAQQKLKSLIADAKKHRKRRAEKKQVITELASQSITNASKLRTFMHSSAGGPPLENTYPQLYEAIVQLATAGAGADSCRRIDILNACKTLDDLRAALLKEGYTSSRQAFTFAISKEELTQLKGSIMYEQSLLKLERLRTLFEIDMMTLISRLLQRDICRTLLRFLVQKTCLFYQLMIRLKYQLVLPLQRKSPLIMHMTYEICLPDHESN